MAGPDSEFWFCFSKAFAMPMPMSMGDCGGVSAGSRAGDWQSVLNYLFEVGAAVSLLNQGQGLLREHNRLERLGFASSMRHGGAPRVAP